MKNLVSISDSSLMIKSDCDWRSWETLGMRWKHVALDDFLGWMNQSDRLKDFAKLSLSAQSHLEPFWINRSFQWRCCFLHKCVSSLHVTHVVLLIMSISAHATNKSSTTKILLCFYSNRHEEKINFHPHLQSEDLRTQKAQRLKCFLKIHNAKQTHDDFNQYMNLRYTTETRMIDSGGVPHLCTWWRGRMWRVCTACLENLRLHCVSWTDAHACGTARSWQTTHQR